jgi:uncharacterized protein YggE
MTCTEYCSKHLSTIEVSASIKRDRTPTQVEVDITLSASASDRNQAYEKFESQIQRFKAVVDSLTDKILTFKVGAPRESTEEVEKTFKKVDEITISAQGTISVSTTDGLGDVIAALIKADLKFMTPRFTYPTITDLEPEHYEKVAAQARAKAEAAARGSGCTLGRVLEIDFPNPQAIEKTKNLRDFWSGHDLIQPQFTLNTWQNFSKASYVPDSSLLDVLNTNVPTYSDEFKVTIKFEIVSG